MNIKKLHEKAETLREQDKLLDALKIYEEVFIKYQKKENYTGLVEALGGRCLTYKHLFLQSSDLSFAIIAKHDALSSLEIAEKFNLKDKLYRCYFRLGEMEMLFKNYKRAIIYYQKSLSLYPSDDAEKGDFIYHLGEAQCLKGETKKGLENISIGLTKIRQFRDVTDSFFINVWESGCLKTLFVFTKDINYLNDAQKIAVSDPRLIIRRRQINELKKMVLAV